MFPPPSVEKSSSSRRSSFSSNAPNSPATRARYARSPSPMPALPAIRVPTAPANTWTSVKLYGDESFTNFFRRLTFSPDGALLLTPAGQFFSARCFSCGMIRFSDKFKKEYPYVQQRWLQTLLRTRGWIVPNYNAPKKVEQIEMLRVVG